MRTYLSYKNQIEGLQDVSETVNMVEKIAASSIHFLKQKVVNFNKHSAEVEKILVRLSLFYKEKNHPLLQKKDTGGKALVILAGDKGLVGGLWHVLINSFLKESRQYKFIIILGAKAKHYLNEEGIQITKSFILDPGTPPKEKIEEITSYIFDKFTSGVFSQVDILYPQFISLAQQQPSFVQFLPFDFALKRKFKRDNKSISGLPIFEPSKREIFNTLLQQYINMFFYKIVTETKLSEFSARTVAMEHAAVKTKGLIRKFTLDYSKERRRATTQKQLEIFAVHKIV